VIIRSHCRSETEKFKWRRHGNGKFILVKTTNAVSKILATNVQRKGRKQKTIYIPYLFQPHIPPLYILHLAGTSTSGEPQSRHTLIQHRVASVSLAPLQIRR
jgi:hypothetical protein